MKHILDSVHGYISVPKDWCDKLIDTVYFQRLRRIEQTSGRSIFPSARHDRFIHSLGVYHLGTRIVNHLKDDINGFYVSEEIDATVFNSYRLACLLHDVSHSPFSHTFEDYYDKDKLVGLLNAAMNNQSFSDDWINKNFDDSAPHEIMSALMVKHVFEGPIASLGILCDINLIARMIVGNPYSDETEENTFRNCMIELIHGRIIDADGLDYACRDSWASGYSTTKVDVDRLIRSIKIVKDDNGKHKVCYTSKAQNAIEAVLNVKTFQQYNVINHHKVTYEQWLIVKAMESAATYHIYGPDVLKTADDSTRKSALKQLCDVTSFTQPIELKFSKAHVLYPMDDDFVSLMKVIPNDEYVSQWLSRKYSFKPLWKSQTEFFKIFGQNDISECLPEIQGWVKNHLIDMAVQLGVQAKDFIFKEVKMKNKMPLASEINLYINGEVHAYTDIMPHRVNQNKSTEFFYVFAKSSINKDDAIDSLVSFVKENIENLQEQNNQQFDEGVVS